MENVLNENTRLLENGLKNKMKIREKYIVGNRNVQKTGVHIIINTNQHIKENTLDNVA